MTDERRDRRTNDCWTPWRHEKRQSA